MSADKILTFIEGCCKLNYFNAIISFRISKRNLTNQQQALQNAKRKKDLCTLNDAQLSKMMFSKADWSLTTNSSSLE